MDKNQAVDIYGAEQLGYWRQGFAHKPPPLTADDARHPCHNIVGAMRGVPGFIQQRQLGHFVKADPAYGEGVAKGLGISMDKVK